MQISLLATLSACGADTSDVREASHEGLAANYQTELTHVLQNSRDLEKERNALDAKYAELTRIVDDDLRENELEQSPLVYHPLELEAMLRVKEDFGDLYIADPGEASVAEEYNVDMPWSGYWYPFRGGELFSFDDSPLAKLDRVAARMNRPTDARGWERARSEASSIDSWEGHCGSWAVASATTREPTRAVTFQGETFTIADQKALITKSHENFQSKMYGVRYLGNADTDGTMQDLRPEGFQLVANTILGEQRRSFVIDSDSGIEVWSKPVYRWRWVAKRDPERPGTLRVKGFPFLIRERIGIDDAPTSTADRSGPAFEYRFYLDPEVRADGKRRVIAGEWIGGSRDSHPDFILAPVVGTPWLSANPEVNKNIDVIETIIRQGIE